MIKNKTMQDGWRVVSFGKVVSNVKMTTKDPATAGLDRVVGLDHLDPDSLSIRRWDLLKDLADGTSFTRTFKAGQVLFGKRRAYQRKVSVPDFDGVCSGDILVFESLDPGLLPEFLPYIVQSDGFFRHALGTSAGSLSPRTKWQELAKYEFVLPPLDEQKRIVEVIAAADRLRSSYSNSAMAASDYWLALSREHLVTDKHVPLETVAEVELGKKRDPKLLIYGKPTPYLRAANVKFGQFELGDVLQMNFTDDEIARFALEDGDVLVTEGCGSIGEVGACATWHKSTLEAVCFQMTLLRLRARDPGAARLLHHWSAYSFKSGKFADVSSGTSVYHLSAARVRKMAFPVLEKQQREVGVALLDSAQKLEQAARAALHEASRLAGRLRESLLTGAVDVH